jgi:hypothetical protein
MGMPKGKTRPTKEEVATRTHKACSMCREIKSLGEFGRRSEKPHLPVSRCNECRNKALRDRYWANPTKYLEGVKHYAENNKEKVRQMKKAEYIRNKDRYKANFKAYRAKHKDEIRIMQVEYARNRRKNDELFLLSYRLRGCVSAGLKRGGYSKKSRTYALLGCTFEEFVQHVGKTPGEGYHLDHIVPCSCARNEEELLKLQHYTNLQWLKKEENLAKHNKKTSKGLVLHYSLLNRYWE